MIEDLQEACIFLAGAMRSMIILTFECMWKDKHNQVAGQLGWHKS